MPRKGENIFKRKDGRWEARFIKGRDASGKARYGYCYGKTYREAKSKAVKAQSETNVCERVYVENDRREFGFYCREWLECRRFDVKASTYVKYESTLRRHILPALGGMLVSNITTQTVESFKCDLISKGLSARTVKGILTQLRTVIRYASDRYESVNINARVDYPKETKKETRVLSLDEQSRLVEFLKCDLDDSRFGVLLALSTGLRIGEVCALRWEDISLSEGTLSVGKTMQRLHDMDGGMDAKTKIIIGEPKSSTSVRTIPLTESMTEMCRRRCPQNKSAYVLTGTDDFMEPRKLQRRFSSYTAACGLVGVHFHTLRHTFATRCMEAGFEIKSLSEILGHSSTSITLDRYVHSSLDQKRLNMKKLDAVGL